MSTTGPHISIPDDALLQKVLGIDPAGAEFRNWQDIARDLARKLAGEMFLARYNPFIDPELVKKSVQRSLDLSRPALTGSEAKFLSEAADAYWTGVDEDRAFAEKVKKALIKRRIVGKGNIASDENVLVECATDATDLRVELPMMVVFPETTEQVRGIVRLANEMAFSVIPRGGGSGLTGGAIPLRPRTIIMSMARLKKITSVDTGDMTICAQAGVITIDAINAAKKAGMLFTVDPASKTASSIGGNVSENSGGPFAFEYGTTIDCILSYEMVTPTGELVRVERRDHPRHKVFPDQTATFDIYAEDGTLKDTVTLTGLEIRSEGLGKDVSNKYLGGLPGVQKEGVDGIITEACFVCHPLLTHSRTLCLEFFGRSMHNAMLVIKDVVAYRDTIREQGDLVKISALEEWGIKYVQAIEYKKKSRQYEGEPISVLLLQLDSDHEQALAEAVDHILSICQPYEGVDVFAARNAREAEIFWEDRHKLSAIAKRTSGFKINEDIVLPLESIPDFALFLEDMNLKYLARVYDRALNAVERMEGLAPDDELIQEGRDLCARVFNGQIVARETSDTELEAVIHSTFLRLRDRYPKLDRDILAMQEKMQDKRVVLANHMHAGDGNCHVNLPVNSSDPEMLAEAHHAAEEVFDKVLELKGQVSGEHGIGITKIGFLAQEKIDALREFKSRVDPNNVVNPDKLTSRVLPSPSYTFSFNRLISDLDTTELKDREQLMRLLKNIQTCTRCGKCKQVCPMYQPERGFMYHPRNKNIAYGALMEAIYYTEVQSGEPAPGLLDRLRRIVEHCTACGRCTAVCPVKIDSAGAAIQMRNFLEYKGKSGHKLKSRVLKAVASDPNRYLPWVARGLASGQSILNRAAGLIPGHWRRRVDLPPALMPGPELGFKTLADELDTKKQCVFKVRDSRPEDTVLYFPGCGANLFSSDIGMAALYTLMKTGVNVVLPDRHLCCGYPLLASGCEEAYKANRQKTLVSMLDLLVKTGKAGLKATTLLTSCGTCRESLEGYDFSRDLADPPQRLDVVQFLLQRIDEPLGASTPVVYHAACHTEWTEQPKAKAPEIYRSSLEELLETEVALSPGCCGESGLGAVTSPDIYGKIRARKAEQLRRDFAGRGADVPLVVGCPSCKMGVRRSLVDAGLPNRVVHTLEYLAEQMGGASWKTELKTMLKNAERRSASVIVAQE